MRSQEDGVAEIRTFIAIAVEQTILARLAAMQQQLRSSGAPVSWVRPEGIHLTLKFLGNVPEARIPEISAALEHVARMYAPFAITIAGLGGFPNLRRPRVVWAGITEGAETLMHLAREVDEALAALGFPREDRPFRPHVTLGRVKAPQGLEALVRQVTMQADAMFGTMTADAVLLIRSELSPQGATYTPLSRAAFRE